MTFQTRPLVLLAKISFGVAMVWACVAAPSRPILEAFVPVQASIYEALMPEHRLLGLEMQQRGAQLTLAVRSQTTRYIVVGSKAYEPGVDFQASTPARSSLLLSMIVVIGAALVIPWNRPGWRSRLVLALGAAVMLAIVIPPLVLAGAQWGLAYGALEELSIPALLVAASNFLLHGGGIALAVTVVWALSSGFKLPVHEP